MVILIIALLAACQQAQLRPVELLPEDMCSYCRMAISESKYAAELITKDGDALKFDDIGCMADYINRKKNRDSVAGYFFVDFHTKRWVKGEEAYFVSSSKFQTPMSGGIVAITDRAQAEATAAEHQGRLLTLAEVIGAQKTGE
ncbi:MAG TPA: nitrous oxide reductase accessory protein NosL [Blastocatellia bacterium]|nr:nitrous oxide reductase accessory protein NosL [Blastocatellia bacterium]